MQTQETLKNLKLEFKIPGKFLVEKKLPVIEEMGSSECTDADGLDTDSNIDWEGRLEVDAGVCLEINSNAGPVMEGRQSESE